MFAPQSFKISCAMTESSRTLRKEHVKHGERGQPTKSLVTPTTVVASCRGFSLLELMVVVVLLGGLIAIAIPSLRAITALDLKNEIMKIAGLSSEVYALAAISGKTHRIVFDFDNRNYWVEIKSGELGEVRPELGYEEIMRSRLTKKDDEKDDPIAQFLPQFETVEGPLGEKQTLPEEVVFRGGWTEQMTEISRSGQTSIYYFPGGFAQASFISLATRGDEEDSTMYLSLSPLTGAIKIDLGEPNIDELVSAENEE